LYETTGEQPLVAFTCVNRRLAAPGTPDNSEIFMNQTLILGVLRHVLQLAAGFAVAKG
jgi:hypothetical protein